MKTKTSFKKKMWQSPKSSTHLHYSLSRLIRKNRNDIIEEIEKGLPYETIEELSSLISITKAEIASIIKISTRTLDRRKGENKFDSTESDRILRIFEVIQRAKEVFNDKETAQRWMKTPQMTFRNKTPLQYCDTEVGANEVKDLLGRIQHGIF